MAGLGVFKDVKLWPGGGRSWDWTETGTHHRPGVQVSDLIELVDHGAKSVVVGTGHRDSLLVKPSAARWLEERGIEIHVHPTPVAVDLYHRLAGDGSPGGLFHTTC